MWSQEADNGSLIPDIQSNKILNTRLLPADSAINMSQEIPLRECPV